MKARSPAGRVAIHGGGGPGGGGGGSTPGRELDRDERRHQLRGGSAAIRSNSRQRACSSGLRSLVPHPRGLEQREAQQALGMLGGERQARRAAAGVADQVEALEARVLAPSRRMPATSWSSV